MRRSRKNDIAATPPLETGEDKAGSKVGDLRIKIWQSSFADFEWFAEVEIFDCEIGYPAHWTRWLGWEYWARDCAASKFKWQRGTWPKSSDYDETEEGARAKGCAMLKAVREFQPVFVKDPEYLTEEYCK